MTPRSVTPVYPADANLIVSLLDLHVASSTSGNGPPSLEILEAGTGHGALTIYLARAINAANRQSSCSSHMGDKEDSKDENLNNVVDGSADSVSLDREGPNPQQKSSYMLERDQRGAVIHTVDVSRTRSESARQMIKGFRHGMYSDAIEFHVGEVSEWIETQFIERDSERSPFLSHVILDLPSTSGNVETAASALKVNGSLVAFNPSITQIMSIVSVIKMKFLPLQLERVIELGQNMTGGREWDVRAVKPRAITRAQNEVASHTTESEDMAHAPATSDNRHFDVESTETDRQAGGESKTLSIEDKSWEMVCRPKVGERVVGGGFLGVWKKMKM